MHPQRLLNWLWSPHFVRVVQRCFLVHPLLGVDNIPERWADDSKRVHY